MKPIIQLRSIFNNVSAVEKGIADFIINNPDQVTKMSIHELAKKSYSSPSSIVRLCKQLGYDGFKEFKHALLAELMAFGDTETHEDNPIMATDSISEIIEKTTQNNIQSLHDSRHLINNKTIEEVVDKLYESHNIYVFGLGSSLGICNDMYIKMTRLGRSCFYTTEYHTQMIQALNCKSNDFCLFVSFSGETEELLELARIAKGNNAYCAALTHYGESSLSKLCNKTIHSSSNESLFSCGTMSSRISQLNLIDIIFNIYCSKHYEEATKNLTKTHIKKAYTGKY
ncbi:MAG: MurR/RpiR family transcriptional regulator [Erysipelotrichaceae bacterium]|nr:MurR/RpiR family transcriptional regulator [Erysipelotrichaceae bacterium]